MKKTILYLLLSVSLFGVISCKKEKTPDPVVQPVVFGSSTHKYIKFTLGTTNYSLDAPTNGAWSGGSQSVYTYPSPNYFKITQTYQPQPGFTLCIEDSTSETVTPLSATYFRIFLTKRNYSYSPVNLVGQSNYSGIYFTTNDNSQVFWSTVNSTNANSNQNGSSFTIIETAEYTQQSTQNIIFKATFNCKLYNNAGDSLMLTNGEMITSFNNY